MSEQITPRHTSKAQATVVAKQRVRYTRVTGGSCTRVGLKGLPLEQQDRASKTRAIGKENCTCLYHWSITDHQLNRKIFILIQLKICGGTSFSAC